MSVARKGGFSCRFVFALLGFWFFINQPVPASSGMLESHGTLVPTVSQASHAPGEVLVKFKAGTPASEKVLIHATADVDVVSEIRELGVQRVKSRRGESTEALLQRYKGDPRVEYAEPNIIYHALVFPNDPRFSDLWGLHNTGQFGGTVDADIDAPEAWDSQIGSPTVVVADIDSGMDLNHPDLAANLWINPGEIAGNGIDDDGNGKVDDYRGWDFANGDNNPSDDYGHGSHTAGTIAAVGNNAVGVTGVAWQAQIMPLKFLDASGSGSSFDAADAIVYAADMGAKISNNSWGCNGASCFSVTIQNAIAYANTAGMLFVVAAGNDGTNNDVTPDYPCAYSQPNIVCVAATDRNDQLASFSNYGVSTVDLGAPGALILSTVPNGSCDFCDPSRYVFASGTSMAAPHVSGAAALIRSQFPSFTLTQVKDAILNAVDPLPSLAGITVTGGRLNVQRALLSNFTVTATPASQTVNAGGSTTFTVTVTSGDGFAGSVALTLGAVDPALTGNFSPATVSVPAGGSATSTLTMSAQSTIATGSYPVVIWGTASTETHTTTVTVVIPPPDLIMTAVTPFSTSVGQGDSLNIDNTAQNQGGSNAGAFTIALHLSVDAVYGGTDDVALTPTRAVSSLAVGASSGATTLVTVPSTTPGGTYYVCGMADSGGAIAEGTAEGNNTLCSTATVTVLLPDLIMTAVAPSSTTVAQGDPLGVSNTVQNQGGSNAGAFTIAFHISVDAVYGGADDVVLAQTRSVSSLAAGASSGATTLVTVPSTTPVGSYYVCAMADSGGVIAEATTEGNNTLCGTLQIDVTAGAGRLANISTRAFVGTGSSAAVGGFIISGTGNKQVLIRGFGPTLSSFGITGALANPTLELSWDDDGNPVTAPLQLAVNDNWGTQAAPCNAPVVACGTPQDITNTGMSADTYAPSNPNRALDAALLVTLPPGLYTVSLSGVSNGTGVGLIGVDDVDTNQTATLVNISTRAYVGTGTDAAVGGFIISGTTNKQVLIRGFGPTLSSFGVSGALGNPTLELSWDNDGNPLTAPLQLAVNDDWGTPAAPCNAPVVACGTPQDIANTGMSADTYAPTNANRGLDAALLVTLPPGLYTVALSGVSNGTGVGLIGVDAVGP